MNSRKMSSRQADAEAKRLTQETGEVHEAKNIERVDDDGFTIGEWKVVRKPRGMSLEEAKAHQEQANLERPFGKTWADIERMQGGKLRDMVPGRVYRDAKGRRAIYQADGTWKELD